MRWVTAKQLKKEIGITNQTLYNWRKENKVVYKELNRRTFLYDIDTVFGRNLATTKKSVAYSRVSNSKQRDDLLRQEETIREYSSKNGIKIDEYYKEIASGMNENRKEFNKIIEQVIENKINKIYITYKDRFTRFGFSYFENLFKKFNCEIVVLNSTNETTFEQELTQDLISIIHYFSMKMYSNRRSKLKELAKVLEEDENN